MKALFTVLIAQIISVSAWSDDVKTTRLDMTGCLKAITVYAPVYRGKVFPMDEDGWSFVVNDRDGSTVYRANGEVYKISDSRKSSKKCENVTTDSTREKSGAGGVVYALYQEVMNDKLNNNYDQRKLIADACKDVVAVANMGTSGAMMGMGGMGMMMSGQGAMVSGEGGMTGYPSQKTKPAGGKR